MLCGSCLFGGQLADRHHLSASPVNLELYFRYPGLRSQQMNPVKQSDMLDEIHATQHILLSEIYGEVVIPQWIPLVLCGYAALPVLRCCTSYT